MSKELDDAKRAVVSHMTRGDLAKHGHLVDELIAAVRADDAAHTDRVADGVAAQSEGNATHLVTVDALRVMAEHLRGLAVGQ